MITSILTFFIGILLIYKIPRLLWMKPMERKKRLFFLNFFFLILAGIISFLLTFTNINYFWLSIIISLLFIFLDFFSFFLGVRYKKNFKVQAIIDRIGLIDFVNILIIGVIIFFVLFYNYFSTSLKNFENWNDFVKKEVIENLKFIINIVITIFTFYGGILGVMGSIFYSKMKWSNKEKEKSKKHNTKYYYAIIRMIYGYVLMLIAIFIWGILPATKLIFEITKSL